MLDKEKTAFLRAQVIDMVTSINEKKDVKYILIQTKNAGTLKCDNYNGVAFKVRERLADGSVENKKWQYEWTNSDMKMVSDICQQAAIANMNGEVKLFKVLGHEFYFGEVDVLSPKTEIEFKDSFMLLKNAHDMISGDKFQYLLVKYEDIDFMYTYGYN